LRANKYAGSCGTCGVWVEAGAGALTGSPGYWGTACVNCVPGAPPRGDHAGWHTAPLASLDFETTGIDPLRDRVLSYALLSDQGDDLCGLINPNVPIPEAAAAVHGLTSAQLAGAPEPAQAFAAISQWVSGVIQRGAGLVVFNAAYDLTMLRAELARHQVSQPDWDSLLVVDPMVIDWSIHRGSLGSRRLSDVATYYQVALDNAHDASADAQAARQIAYEIGKRHADVARGTLEDLMVRQRAWYAAKAENWNAYARRVGRTLDDPHGWPLKR
jgi:DNA polymerase-3 subunit epsilon